MNRKKSIRNVSSELLNQLLVVVFGAIVPRFVLVHLGSETNGLVSSISQVLTYLALLEAGVGSAALQALFSPFQRKARNEIGGIMSAVKQFYLRTGSAYLAILLCLSVIYPLSVRSDISKVTIGLVVLISGVPSVISFFFQGKYLILLNADGKNYISKNLGSYTYVLNSVLKIVLLSCGMGVIAVQSLGILASVIQVVCIELYVRRHYGWLNLREKPDYGAIRQSKNALVHQVAWLITSNTDTIILTYIGGLKVVSIYTMYRLFLSVVDGVINAILNGLHFLLGQSFQEDRGKYLRQYDVLEIVVIVLSFALFCVARVFLLPFLELYTAGVHDVNYLDWMLPYLFAAVHILVESRGPAWETISVAGHFRKTQHQSIIEAGINVVVSVPLAFRWGIHGVLMGTIAASSYRLIAMVTYSNKKILRRSAWPTFRRYLLCVAAFVGTTWAANRLFSPVDMSSYYRIVLYALGMTAVVVPLFFALVFWFDREAWRDARQMMTARERQAC